MLNVFYFNQTEMKTILIIEDTEPFLENLTEYFEMHGFKIVATRNGKTGVKLAEECSPDLVICDLLMPGMDGYQVLKSILLITGMAEVPFIFSTAMSENIDREKAMTLGADDYIVKPFQLETLLRMAKFWIKSGSHRHQNLTGEVGISPIALL
jgi:DNA-binding response OmpR family regulator